jgi:hypothetical protein
MLTPLKTKKKFFGGGGLFLGSQHYMYLLIALTSYNWLNKSQVILFTNQWSSNSSHGHGPRLKELGCYVQVFQELQTFAARCNLDENLDGEGCVPRLRWFPPKL